MREIVLDTETTGLDPNDAHRIVEIGCLELINRLPSGENYHQYINPERAMPEEAFRIHGISDERLAKEPVFADIADAFLEFIGDSPLVIHNAKFDLKFINAELRALDLAPIGPDRKVVDTIALARRQFPGAPASLDALCKRFDIDLSQRTLHGALLDCRLLADVYLELTGGRQSGLDFVPARTRRGTASKQATTAKGPRPRRPHAARAAEIEAHQRFLQDKVDNPLWLGVVEKT